MAEINFPVIGDIVLSGRDKVLNKDGKDKHDIMGCDGSEFDENIFSILGSVIPKSKPAYVSHSRFSAINNLSGICTDNEFIWVVGFAGNVVYKYTADFSTLVSSFSVGGQMSQSLLLMYDGEFLWVSDNASKRIFKYNERITR